MEQELKDPRSGIQQMLNTGLEATCGGYPVIVPEMSLSQIHHVMAKFTKVFSEVIERVETATNESILNIMECAPMVTGSVGDFIQDLLLWKNSKGVSRNPDMTPEMVMDCLQTEAIDIIKKFIQINPAARKLVGKFPALGRMIGMEEAAPDSPRA